MINVLGHYEYRPRINDPLAFASAYHIEKLWREAAHGELDDLACAAQPARTWRSTLQLGWDRDWRKAFWKWRKAGVSMVIHLLLRRPAHA